MINEILMPSQTKANISKFLESAVFNYKAREIETEIFAFKQGQKCGRGCFKNFKAKN